MVLRFGGGALLTDRDNSGKIDAAVLAGGGLQAAADEINGYIGGRYTLPLPVAPSDLRGIACDIARYRLTGTERVCADEIRGRYRGAIRYLENVANGRVTLATNPKRWHAAGQRRGGVLFRSPRLGAQPDRRRGILMISEIENAMMARLKAGLVRMVSAVGNYGGELDDVGAIARVLSACWVTFLGVQQTQRVSTHKHRFYTSGHFSVLLAAYSVREEASAQGRPGPR